MKKITLIMVIGATLLLLSGCGNDETPNTLPSANSNSPTTSVTSSEVSGGVDDANKPEDNDILPSDKVGPVVIDGFTRDYVFERDG